jgi:hypothetical protein
MSNIIILIYPNIPFLDGSPLARHFDKLDQGVMIL